MVQSKAECSRGKQELTGAVWFAGCATGLVLAAAVLSLLCSAAALSSPALPPQGETQGHVKRFVQPHLGVPAVSLCFTLPAALSKLFCLRAVAEAVHGRASDPFPALNLKLPADGEGCNIFPKLPAQLLTDKDSLHPCLSCHQCTCADAYL